MSAEMVMPEKLAMLVHRYREALAPHFGCSSSLSPEWEELSREERNRMVAATRLALLDLQVASSRRISSENPPVPGFAGGTEGKECGC
jgi:hypothetical protein